MRLETGFAQVCAMISNIAGGKATPADFMPHNESDEITLDDAMKDWK